MLPSDLDFSPESRTIPAPNSYVFLSKSEKIVEVYFVTDRPALDHDELPDQGLYNVNKELGFVVEKLMVLLPWDDPYPLLSLLLDFDIGEELMPQWAFHWSEPKFIIPI